MLSSGGSTAVMNEEHPGTEARAQAAGISAAFLTFAAAAAAATTGRWPAADSAPILPPGPSNALLPTPRPCLATALSTPDPTLGALINNGNSCFHAGHRNVRPSLLRASAPPSQRGASQRR